MAKKILSAVGAVLGVIAGTALFIMMILTFIDVIGRYGFNKSIFGVAEWIEMLMVLTIFSGIAFITATNDHITVTMFDGWIVRNIPDVRRWAVIVFSIVCYAFIIWELYGHALDMWTSGKRTAVLDMPQWYQPAAGAVLSTAGLILLLIATLHSRGHLSRLKHSMGFVASDGHDHSGAGN